MTSANDVKTILRRDGYFDAVTLIETSENSISRKAEFQYLKAYARESSFDEDICRNQFRCLWTAYCFHHELAVDTAGYDNDLLELWNFMANCGYPLIQWWGSFYTFGSFMCKYLV